jgi:eukaryotic-like serine/threonine-protein kinase
MPPPPLLAGRYRLESLIAAGGVGEVWRAHDMVLSRPVAVKLLRAEHTEHAETLARFRAEAHHAGALSHPAIARVLDYREQVPPHPPFLVLELVDGPSLAAILTAGPLTADQTMDVVMQVAAGLEAAHETGLIHRDIKPGNLLLTRKGQVKITDFGIAHVAGSAPVTRTGTVIGTPAYLAPERVSGASATPASDLYSLGIVAYECLAGTPPFNGQPVDVAVAHRDRPLPPFPLPVPAEVAQLVADLTVKDPAARPASAQEVAVRAGRLREDMAGPDGTAGLWVHTLPAVAAAALPAPGPDPADPPTIRWQDPPTEGLRRPRRPRRIAAAAVLAAGGVIAAVLLAVVVAPGPAGGPLGAAPTSQLATRPPSGAPSPSATPRRSHPAKPSPPVTVDVMAASLVGEPVDQVRRQLRLLGLDVRVRQIVSDQETGTVVAVSPSGPVNPASTIVVSVAVAPAQGGQDGGHHHQHGHGNTAVMSTSAGMNG